MTTNDKDFLGWIYDRLTHVHGENENYDYMHRLKKIIDTIDDEELLLEFSAYLHRLPDLPNGHQIGMVEVGFGQDGEPNYGPFWMSQTETNEIARRFLASRKDAPK